MTPLRPRTEGDWLLVPAPQEHRPFRLFCFPHAGGDATAFTPLAHAIAPAAEVWGLRMPARGGRRRTPMPAGFDLLVRTVAAALRPHLDGRFGFYGQSFGSLLAFEVARALPPGLRPELVIATGASPPNTWAAGRPPEYDADELLRTAGLGELVHADPELRALALSTVRTDLDVRRTYRYRPLAPIESDLYTLAGDGDALLDAEQLAGWAEHTTGAFGSAIVPGGHLLATVEQSGPVDLLTAIIGRRTTPDTYLSDHDTWEQLCSVPRWT